jgi:hypothetical protein
MRKLCNEAEELSKPNFGSISKSLLPHADYKADLFFHCYWSGDVTEKHLNSIKSCYLFNIQKSHYKNRKIIFWVENNKNNIVLDKISKYAEVRQFNLDNEQTGTPFINRSYDINKTFPFYSDLIRCILLYKYGGVWFDLDNLFIDSFDRILGNFSDEILVYSWEFQDYPNNAIFIVPGKENTKFGDVIDFFIKRNRGFGFQQNISLQDSIDMLILPCLWFDAGWLKIQSDTLYDPSAPSIKDFFKKTDKKVTLDNFAINSFCYHWHNKWDDNAEDESYYCKLVNEIDSIIDHHPINP